MSINKIFEKKPDKITITWHTIEVPDCWRHLLPTQYEFEEMKRDLDGTVQQLNDEMDGINN